MRKIPTICKQHLENEASCCISWNMYKLCWSGRPFNPSTHATLSVFCNLTAVCQLMGGCDWIYVGVGVQLCIVIAIVSSVFTLQ